VTMRDAGVTMRAQRASLAVANGDVPAALARFGRSLARLDAAHAEPLKKLTIEEVMALSHMSLTEVRVATEEAAFRDEAQPTTLTRRDEASRTKATAAASPEASAQPSTSPLDYLKRALRKAAAMGDLDEVTSIAECGGDEVLQGRDHHGQTALHLAAAEGHLHVVKFLSERCEGLLTAAGVLDRSPLHQARDLEVLKFLCERGAGSGLLMQRDMCGYTALHHAAKREPCQVDAAWYLISCGGLELMLALDNKKNTALFLAARVNSIDVVRALVEAAGAAGPEALKELLALKGQGTWEVEKPMSPLEVARERKNFAVASYLEEQTNRLG